MICSLRGRLAGKTAGRAVVECGGVGYDVQAPLTVIERLPEVGEEVFLLTEFVVRETGQALYGFLTERERLLFVQLMKTSGVGAKTVLAMMSAMTVDELVAALSSDDAARLALAPGIGKKTAERLIVDFRGSALLVAAASAAPAVDGEVEQALAALGYKKAEIKKALSRFGADAGEGTAERVRTALRILSGRARD